MRTMAIKVLVVALVLTVLAGAQDVVGLRKLLALWPAHGEASVELLDEVFREIVTIDPGGSSGFISNGLLTELKSAGVPEAAALKALDARRYQRVEAVLKQLIRELEEAGVWIEAAIRTGSSGLRHLEIANAGGDLSSKIASAYKYFRSDDDITFIGKGAEEAQKRFNILLREQGLDALKVKGFDLKTLNEARGLDLAALNLLDREKFVGEAALRGIQAEMLVKGAVIAARDGGGPLLLTAESLEEFVTKRSSELVAELFELQEIAQAARKFGALTMVGSCEKQIMGHGKVHPGELSDLTASEAVKYIQRQRTALAASGALADLTGRTAEDIRLEAEKIEALRVKAMGLKNFAELTEAEQSFLNTLRHQNIELAFEEAPYRLRPLLTEAAAKGTKLANNPAVRKYIEELATGFALMRQGVVGMSDLEILDHIRGIAQGDSELYSILYTSYEKSIDLFEVVDSWMKKGGDTESFAKLLAACKNNLEIRNAIAARKRLVAGTPQEKSLAELEKMMEKPEGEGFLRKMLNGPAARRFLVVAIASGAGTTLGAVYDAWVNGDEKSREDLGNSALAVMDFVPLGMSVRRAYMDGIDAPTTFQFIKEALYLTPAWKLALTADLITFAWEYSESLTISAYNDALIDLLVYNGDFQENGDGFRFTALVLPDNRRLMPEQLKGFLFYTGQVSVKDAAPLPNKVIPNLREAAETLLDKQYAPHDRALQEMRLAVETQLNAINRSRITEAAGSADLWQIQTAYGVWLAGLDDNCAASKAPWCRVYRELQKHVRERLDFIAAKVMVPQMIELATAKYSALHARLLVSGKFPDLQKQIEQLRGTSLGVDLAAEVERRAAANGRSSMLLLETAGRYWLEAWSAYKDVYEKASNIPANIQRAAAYPSAKVLQFPFNGDYEHDHGLAEQSRAAYAHALSQIRADIAAIKKGPPLPDNSVDRQALQLLSGVVFPWRVRLDRQGDAEPKAGSPYASEYAAAIEKVRSLYGLSAAFQPRLESGASIVKDASAVVLNSSIGLELRLKDPVLLADYLQGRLAFEWSASPGGEFQPDTRSLKVRYLTKRPETATVTVRVRRVAAQPESGTLSTTVPVRLPEDFLSLRLNPVHPIAARPVQITAEYPESFLGAGNPFHYEWSCSGCEVQNRDLITTSANAPASGIALVTLRLMVDDGQGGRTLAAWRSAEIEVNGTGAKPAADPGVPTAAITGVPAVTPPGEKPPVDTKKPAEKPPVDAKKPGEKAPTPIPTPSPKPGQNQTVVNSLVTFAGTVPGIWDGGNNANGFDFKRQTAKAKGVGDCWDASVQSNISGRIDQSFSADTPETITKKVNDFIATSKPWGKIGVARQFAIGDFKGQFVDTSIAFIGGTWGDGFNAGSVSASGHGWLSKGGQGVEIEYNISGSGCWDSTTDKTFLMSQAAAAQADAKSIVASLKLVEKGSFTNVPYTGPKLDGSDMPKVTLSPPILEKLKVGDTVNISVVVGNAKPEDMPFRYNWVGEFDGKPETSKDKATITIKPKKPGKYPLSVSVDGARYNLGSASLEYEIADLKAEIKQELPTTKSIAVGLPVTFSAKLLSSGVLITGNYVYRWQPTPEVTFEPAEGQSNQTKTVFSRPGVTKVWVQILEKKGTVLTTIAESNQLEIDVVKPEISLRMFPAQPYPGQEVRITASEAPAVGDAFITYWWEYTGSAINPGGVADPRVYTFRPKDTTPVTVTAHAKAKDGGDDLGTKAIVITARPHTVQVTGPTARGPKPQVWSPSAGGLVEEAQQLAVFQDVSMRADVTPAPINQPPHYQWAVSPEGCTISNPISQEPTFNCSQTGSFTALVTVRDNLGATLGTGTGSISISISQASLQNSKAQADAAKLAAQKQLDDQARRATAVRLRAEGQALQQQGKLREAIVKYRESLTYVADPAMDKFIAQVEAEAAKQEQAAQQAKLDTAKQDAKLAAQKQRDDQARRATAVRLRAEGQALQQQGKLREAIAKYRESLTYVADPAMDKFIAQVEAEVAKQEQAATKVDTSAKPSVNPIDIGEDRLGREWSEIEGGITGRWVRRGNSNIWDASWPNSQNNGAVAVLSMSIAGDRVKITRTDVGVTLGLTAVYEGTLAADGTLQGTEIATFPGHFTNQTFDWQARIVAPVDVPQPPANSQHGRLTSGRYRIIANNSQFEVILTVTGSAFSGYETSQGIEIREFPITNGIISGDKVAFHRTTPSSPIGQDYQGRIQNNKIVGTFTGAGGAPGQQYPWELELTTVGAKPAPPPTAKPATNAPPSQLPSRPPVVIYPGVQAQEIVKDYNGNTYKTIRIGSQVWMAENLKVTNYRNGDPIPNVTEPEQWRKTSTGAYCSYNNSYANADYGYLYNWYAATDKRNIAPVGWHVPNNKDWTILIDQLGGEAAAGNKLKETGVTHWKSPNLGANNESGFTGLPNGRRSGDEGGFWFLTTNSNWWSTDEMDLSSARCRPLTVNTSECIWGYERKNSGISIRLVKDDNSASTSSAPPAAPPVEVTVFDSMNTYGVGNQPTAPAAFTIRRPHVITSIMTYHWNDGRGTRAGTIALRNASGRTYGPWPVIGTPGQGGVPNAAWTCNPNVEVPAGTYTIVDSEPVTWSQNPQSGGRGMAVIKGYPIDSAVPPTTPSLTPRHNGHGMLALSAAWGSFVISESGIVEDEVEHWSATSAGRVRAIPNGERRAGMGGNDRSKTPSADNMGRFCRLTLFCRP